MHGHFVDGAGPDNASRGVVFRPSQSSEVRWSLGALAAFSLLTGVGVPVAIFLGLDIFRWWLLILLIIVTVLPFVTSAVLLRNLRYNVGPAGVTVHHFGAKLYRWDSIRAVEVWRKRPRSFNRIGAGASIPGYNVGRFRGSEVGDVQVYATILTPPLIVLKTHSTPVMLSPEDVDGFVAAVQRYSGRVDIVDKE